MPLSTLQPGDRLDDHLLLLTSQRTGTTRNGQPFLTLTLQDESGQVTGRVWSPEATCPDGLRTPHAVRVTGRVESFRDERQLNVESIREVDADADAMRALVPASRWEASTLQTAIREHILAWTQPDGPIRRLLLHLLDDPEIAVRYTTVAAAAANHHAYWAGLAEHTLSMLRVAALLHTHYERYYPGLLDRELLLAGVVLHDMGKVWEFEAGPVPTYSTEGRLVGHIPIMAARIDRAARELGDVPSALVHELQHLVLAHHGEYEYGSPRRPKTAEAQLLHYIDQIDAKLNIFAQLEPESGWSPFHRAMGRPLLRADALRAAWRESSPPPPLPDDGPGGAVLPRTDRPEEGRASSPTDSARSRGKSADPGPTMDLFDGLGGD